MQPDREAAGATYKVGAKSSEVTARLYEKGKQMRDENRPHWTRYEVQMRPQKDRKTWATSAEPAAILGAAAWSRKFVTDALDVVATAPPARPERVADLEGSLRALTSHYGNRMLELLEVHDGDLAAFGAELIERASNGGLLLPR